MAFDFEKDRITDAHWASIGLREIEIPEDYKPNKGTLWEQVKRPDPHSKGQAFRASILIAVLVDAFEVIATGERWVQVQARFLLPMQWSAKDCKMLADGFSMGLLQGKCPAPELDLPPEFGQMLFWICLGKKP